MSRDKWNATTSLLTLAAALVAGLTISALDLDDGTIKPTVAAAQSADDSESGSDSDSDSGSDGDAGTDSGTGDEGDADSDSGTDSGTDGEDAADSDSGTDSSTNDEGDADSEADTDAGAEASGEDAGAGTKTNADTEVDTGTSASADSQPAADSGIEGPVVDEGTATSDQQTDNLPAIEPIDRRYGYFASLNVETVPFQRYRAAAERNDLEAAGKALTAATDRPITTDLVKHVNAELEVQTSLTARQIAAAANNVPVFRFQSAVPSAVDTPTAGPATQ